NSAENQHPLVGVEMDGVPGNAARPANRGVGCVEYLDADAVRQRERALHVRPDDVALDDRVSSGGDAASVLDSDPNLAVARDNVAEDARPADGDTRCPKDVDAGEAVGDRKRDGGIRADEVDFYMGVRRIRTLNDDAIVGVAGDQVARVRGCAAN